MVKILMNQYSENEILKRFDSSAETYKSNSDVQKYVAIKLAEACKTESIPSGLWLDLGSGTGLLADIIETKTPNQSVVRVDYSKKMLLQQDTSKTKIIWNLNEGIPLFKEDPKLIASSFLLHWLKDPEKKLYEWFSLLERDSWIAIAIPICGCFAEWKEAADEASVPFTANNLPQPNSILKYIENSNIKYNRIISYKDIGPNPTYLLKKIINVGAHTKNHQSLKPSQWKKLKNKWIEKKNGATVLTWLIQIVLIKK